MSHNNFEASGIILTKSETRKLSKADKPAR